MMQHEKIWAVPSDRLYGSTLSANESQVFNSVLEVAIGPTCRSGARPKLIRSHMDDSNIGFNEPKEVF